MLNFDLMEGTINCNVVPAHGLCCQLTHDGSGGGIQQEFTSVLGQCLLERLNN